MAARRRLPANVERVDRGSNGTGYRARVQVCGKNIRGRIHKTVGEAVEDARKLATQVTRHGGPETITEAFDAILRVCEDADRRPATVAFYEENRKVIEGHFGASKRIHSIRVEDVQDWVREMRRRGNKPGTLRARLRALRRVFRIAGREPVRLDQLVMPDVQEPDPRSFLTLGDVRALLAKLGPQDIADPPDSFWMVGFLVLTGARRAEVARMRKDDVQPDRVVIPVGKKRPRVIPWPDTVDAREMVRRLRQMSDTEWLLPGRSRQVRNESKRRDDGGEAARIEWLVRLSREWRRAEPRATLHRLRAAMASILAGLDPPVPIPVVAHLLGHQATTAAGITGLYARPAEAHVREAVRRLWEVVAADFEVEEREVG